MSLRANDDFIKLYDQLEATLMAARRDPKELYSAITQAPFEYNRDTALLFLGFICFFSVDEAAQTIRLISFTDNDYYRQSVEGYAFKPAEYAVPLKATDNDLVAAVVSQQPVVSTNWDSLRRPKVAKGVARLNQASSGIACSVAYPFRGKVRGVLLYNFFEYQENIGKPQYAFMKRYTQLVAQALDGLPQPIAG